MGCPDARRARTSCETCRGQVDRELRSRKDEGPSDLLDVAMIEAIRGDAAVYAHSPSVQVLDHGSERRPIGSSAPFTRCPTRPTHRAPAKCKKFALYGEAGLEPNTRRGATRNAPRTALGRRLEERYRMQQLLEGHQVCGAWSRDTSPPPTEGHVSEPQEERATLRLHFSPASGTGLHIALRWLWSRARLWGRSHCGRSAPRGAHATLLPALEAGSEAHCPLAEEAVRLRRSAVCCRRSSSARSSSAPRSCVTARFRKMRNTRSVCPRLAAPRTGFSRSGTAPFR